MTSHISSPLLVPEILGYLDVELVLIRWRSSTGDGVLSSYRIKIVLTTYLTYFVSPLLDPVIVSGSLVSLMMLTRIVLADYVGQCSLSENYVGKSHGS